MNRGAKKNIESIFVIAGLFVVVLLSVFAVAFPYVLYSAKFGTAENGTFENASDSSAKFFNITINWTNASFTAIYVNNNWSQVNITLPPNFTFLHNAFFKIGNNGTNASYAGFTFTNTTNFNAYDNISNVLSWSNFASILLNGSENGTFWFNATPGTAGWYNITVTIVNQTAGSGAGVYGQIYRNVSVFVNTTVDGPSLLNQTSGETVPAGHNFSALKSGMNYSNASLDVIRITGPVDYPEILRIAIINNTGAAEIVNFTGNQSTTGTGPNPDGYWYKKINASYQMSNVTNGTTLTYNITILVREGTNNLSDNYTFFNIRFDNTKPIVQSANISGPTSGGNYSQNITLNITGTDATGITGFWNITNASAAAQQNLTLEIRRSDGNIMISDFNTTYIPDGIYNISFFANDTAGNNNNHSDTYAGAPKVTGVRIDNTVPTVTLAKNTASSTKNKLVVDITVSDKWPGNINGACTADRGSGAIDGSGAGTHTYTEQNLACGTSITLAITCNDFAGNSKTTSITTSTNACGDSGGGGGGSGGGSGGTTWSNTYAEDNVELGEKEGGVQKELGGSQRVKLKVSGDTHYVGLKSLTASTATIEVSSTPQEATLQVGDERKFDIDADGSLYDLYVKLNSIANNKADVTIMAISETITEETIAEEGAQQQEAENAAGEEESLPPPASKSKSMLIIVIVLAIIIAGVVYFVVKRK